MLIAIPKESFAGERRVAATPDSVRRLVKLGATVRVESGAGHAAAFSDSAYLAAGAEVESDVRELWRSANLVLKIQPPQPRSDLGGHEVDLLSTGACLVGFLWPARNPDLLTRLAARGVNALAMDRVPRISRAQKLDALSSMANIAGYRAVVEAAHHFGRFFTGQVTAAGKVPPARVLVIGAGVAGLSAIGTARGLGAVVQAFDTRPEVKDQVRSMGAEFLELSIKEDGAGEGGYAKAMTEAYHRAEVDLFQSLAPKVDIIVTTALIPGRPAPTLITTPMVSAMQEGAVIVDMAAETGGNCALTRADEVIKSKNGVTIIGYTDLPSRLPTQASQLYGTNLVNLVTEMMKTHSFTIDLADEVVREMAVVSDGKILEPPPKRAVPQTPKTSVPAPAVTPAKKSRRWAGSLTILAVLACLLSMGSWAPNDFLNHLTVFVLACVVGWLVVWNVTPALHTPLMSVTNAISGIIVVGALLQVRQPLLGLSSVLGLLAIVLATINVAGGFVVTQRMLGMFRRERS